MVKIKLLEDRVDQAYDPVRQGGRDVEGGGEDWEEPDVRAMQRAVDEGSIAYPPQITAQQAGVLERALLARLPAGGGPAAGPGV